jgi:superfamily II DNA/RNA helicase
MIVCFVRHAKDGLKITLFSHILIHRFLVMDEADRLLSQSYQGWIPSLLQAASENTIASVQACADGGFSVIQEPASSSAGSSTNVLTKDRSHSLRKLLFSATLTRNPSKLAPLRLVDPVYFAAKDARYQTPKELKEFMVPLGAGEKPLALIHLLARHGHAPAVCFTNSLASAHRLYRLLEIYGLSVHLFSSELPQVKRAIYSSFQHCTFQHMDAFMYVASTCTPFHYSPDHMCTNNMYLYVDVLQDNTIKTQRRKKELK